MTTHQTSIELMHLVCLDIAKRLAQIILHTTLRIAIIVGIADLMAPLESSSSQNIHYVLVDIPLSVACMCAIISLWYCLLALYQFIWYATYCDDEGTIVIAVDDVLQHIPCLDRLNAFTKDCVILSTISYRILVILYFPKPAVM